MNTDTIFIQNTLDPRLRGDDAAESESCKSFLAILLLNELTQFTFSHSERSEESP